MIKIIEPLATLIQNTNNIEHVCKCAAVCYDSTPKIGEAAEKFYQGLVNSKHYSPLRHGTRYFVVNDERADYYEIIADDYSECPYVDFTIDGDALLVVTNNQFFLENDRLRELFSKYEVTAEEFAKYNAAREMEMMRYTFKLTTQISTSRELNRKSPNNITERSTRYVDYEEPVIVRPHWITKEAADRINSGDTYYYEMGYDHTDDPKEIYDAKVGIFIGGIENAYRYIKDLKDLGMGHGDTRGLIPLDSMTEVYYTYSVKEWREIINLRYWGSTGRPHENCKIIIGQVKEELEKLGYEFKSPFV